MTLKKLIENTTAASNPSWIIRWTTFTAGWWKSLPMAMRMPSATTRTPRPHAITNSTQTVRFSGSAENSVLFCTSMLRALIALILAASLSLGGAADAFAQSSRQKRKAKKPKAAPCQTGCKPETSAPNVAADAPADEAAQRELWDLARAMRNGVPGAYERLSAFAVKNTTSVWGARAALALGYEDNLKNRNAQSLGWLLKAQNETMLREYALYWTAQAQRALGRYADSYKVLQTIQRDYPNTAMRETLLESFAPPAVLLGHAQEAIDALNAYPATTSKSTLLYERAHAYQAAHQLPRAAKDYQTVFYKFPLADEAKPAGSALSQVMHALGKEYVYPGVELQEQRAQAFYDAHKWKEARAEYEKLLTMLKDPANPARQRAQLRVAECRVQLKGSPSLIAAVKTPDLEVDAERLYALSQAYRSAKKEADMFSALNTLAKDYPESKWNEDGLMAAGNYHWVELEREKAVVAYQRVLDSFPNGKYAFNCEWRIAWVAYLNHQPDADDRLTIFLVKYPVSANSVDALYWLGRNAERGGNAARARGLYNKAVERFPQTYFGNAAAARLAKLGPGEENPPEFLEKIPPPPSLRPFDESIPVAAADRWA